MIASRKIVLSVYFICVIFLSWQIIVIGLSQYYLSLDENNTPDKYQKALNWDANNFDAKFNSLQKYSTEEKSDIEKQLEKLLVDVPFNGKVLLPLMQLWLKSGDFERADRAAILSSQLLPASPTSQMQLAAYWLARNDLAQAMKHWTRVLSADRSYDKVLFPLYIQLSEQEQGLVALRNLLRTSPNWWARFIIYTIRSGKSLDSIKTLYNLSFDVGRNLELAERQAYFNRLIREKYWGEAYFAWLNSLNNEQKSVLGQMFNGGFEQKFLNSGFGWFAQDSEAALIKQLSTYGNSGELSLKITFRNKPIKFQHLYQRLFLSEGRYRIRGRVRKDSIQAKQGLQWQLRCISGRKTTIAYSERFLGVDQWRNFHFDLEVPSKNCAVQEIRLVTSGVNKEDFIVSGVLWFDDFKVRRRK